MSIDRRAIESTLQRLAAALAAGEAAAVAALWEVPGLVLADEGARAIGDRAEVEAFFAQAIDWYRQQGIPGVAPRLIRFEPLTAKLASVDVEWRGLDAAGGERTSETSHYLVRLGADGVARVQVALTRSDTDRVAA